MPTVNPLFAAWSFHKFHATIIDDILPEVIFFSTVATMVTTVSKLTPHSLAINNQMLTVLGLVLGLVVSFRTSSAYERYSEGRKLWSDLTLTSRNIAMNIWVHVPHERVDKVTKEKVPTIKVVVEKKSMINLVQAYSVSIKHFLRGEQGIYYEDLHPLICWLPRFSCQLPELRTKADVLPLWSEIADDASVMEKGPSPRPGASTASLPVLHTDGNRSQASSFSRKKKIFDPEAALPDVMSDRPLKPSRNPPPTTLWDYSGFLRFLRPIFRVIRGRHTHDLTAGGRIKKTMGVESNVPLEISLFLQSYAGWLIKEDLLPGAIASALVGNIAALQNIETSLERIRNTPLPFAYQAHLRICTWIYIFTLPFQIYTAYGWLTIPATTFGAFLLLGFLEIGAQIENPFNYDANDLDLDQLCLTIQRELHEICAHTSPNHDTFVYSAWNQPFAPADRRTAEEMDHDVEHDYHKVGPGVGIDSIRRTLLQSWRNVDTMTRKQHDHHKV
jgi:predicted membrane chloride channel (bestrophin family)